MQVPDDQGLAFRVNLYESAFDAKISHPSVFSLEHRSGLFDRLCEF
jgi:hypothetical protein